MLDEFRKKTEEIFFNRSFENKIDSLAKSTSKEVAAKIKHLLDFDLENSEHNFEVFTGQFSAMLTNGIRNTIRTKKSSNLDKELLYIFVLAMSQLSQRLQDANLIKPEQDYELTSSCREIQNSFAARVLEKKK